MKTMTALSALTLCGLLAACNSNPQNSGEMTPPASAPTEQTQPASAEAASMPIANAAPTTAASMPVAADSHNTANAVDWVGSYSGVLPCADCDGIETTLTLMPNKTYTLTEHYRGNKDVFKTSGSFTWDAKGQQVILDKKGDNRRFFIGEKIAKEYTPEGEERTDELADDYILQKK